MLLKVDQRQKLERQKRERQTQDEKEKKKVQWDSPQKRADFNRKMRQKLKEGIKDLSDLVLLLESLPPTVLQNAKLVDDLPKVTEFVEAFLEKADLRPVAEHESGELRTFRNYLICMETHPEVDGWDDLHYIKIVNGKRYSMDSINITASPHEIHCCDLLKNHILQLQRYVDPNIVVIEDDKSKVLRLVCDVPEETRIRGNIMGQCESNVQVIKDKIPTKQQCKPRALIDGKLYDIPMAEEMP